MNQFKNLIVWKKSLMLAGKVYELTEKLPSKEKFGLTTQLIGYMIQSQQLTIVQL